MTYKQIRKMVAKSLEEPDGCAAGLLWCGGFYSACQRRRLEARFIGLGPIVGEWKRDKTAKPWNKVANRRNRMYD